MEESKKVNTEHFKKKIGNTTYRVRVHFPQNTKRTFTDSVNTLIMNVIIPGLFEPPIRTLRATIPENESHIFR